MDCVSAVVPGTVNGALNACSDDWVDRPDLYVTFRKAIEADHEKNMKAIPRKQRAMVRKGIQNGLRSVVPSRRRQCCIASMPRACAISARRCSPAAISLLLAEAFGDDCDIVTVLDGDSRSPR